MEQIIISKGVGKNIEYATAVRRYVFSIPSPLLKPFHRSSDFAHTLDNWQSQGKWIQTVQLRFIVDLGMYNSLNFHLQNLRRVPEETCKKK